MSALRVRAALAAVILVAGSACVIPVYGPEGERWWGRGGVYQRTLSFEPGGTLSLENGLGDIEIRGTDAAEVEITAEEGVDGYRGRRIALGGYFGRIPDVEVERDGDALRIRTRRASGGLEDVRAVHYFLRVPHSVVLKDIRGLRGRVVLADVYGGARIEMEESDVKVTNYSGSLEVTVDRGSVDAEVLDLRPDDEVRLTSREGGLTLRLEGSAAARIEAGAPNGDVTADFDLGTPLPARRVSGRIGPGEGAAVSLTALNGDVRIVKTGTL